MIKIVCTYQNKNVTGIEVSGHANSAKSGKDIICAAVSAIIITGVNNIKDLKKSEVKSQDGYVKISCKHTLDKEGQIELNLVAKMLKEISDNYPKNIKFKKEK